MLSDERIEQLELEVKVLRANNKGLKDKIDEQSKEIEELKKYEKYYEEMEEVNKKFIAVDKIKAKIEEVGNGTYDAKIVLESLLEKENNNGTRNRR